MELIDDVELPLVEDSARKPENSSSGAHSLEYTDDQKANSTPEEQRIEEATMEAGLEDNDDADASEEEPELDFGMLSE